jgi:hypothetical protein
MKKIFFCGRAGIDCPGAWCKMMTEAEARDMVSDSLKKAGWEGKPLSKLRVERHDGEDGARIYVWGEDEPGFQGDDYGQHEGTRVEVDGKVVYNDLVPLEDEDGDHEDCEDCADDEDSDAG